MMDSISVFSDVYFPGPNINDHSFIFVDGVWHLFHIWLELGTPLDDVIGHATGDDLIHWDRQPDILPKTPRPSWECRRGANAPYCFQWQDTFYLLYSRYDQPEGRRSRQHIGLATSKDLFEWRKCENNPIFHPAPSWCPWEDETSDQYRPGCCRDPHVMRIDNKFVLYYVAMTRESRISAVGHAFSDDLIHWEDRGAVATAPVVNGEVPMCESPCIVEFGGRWHLFYTYGPGIHHAVSDSPFRFDKAEFLLPAHASEVFEWNGDCYISHCAHGGLSLARIDLSVAKPRVLPL